MPHHLVQVAAETNKLIVDQTIYVAASLRETDWRPLVVEQQGAAEMRRPHAEGRSPLPDAFQLACREAEIELLCAGLGSLWPSHVLFPWQSACVPGFGDPNL